MAVESGNEHVTLSKAETDVIQSALEPVVDRWVKEVTASGIDGAGLVSKARTAISKHSGM